jgi:hypothetical protein
MRIRLAAFIAVATVVPAVAALGQGSITGFVRDTAGRAIANAEVMVLDPERRIRTDTNGYFTINSLPAGTYELRARRLGFFAAQTTIVLRDYAIKRLLFQLPARPVMLDTVNITADCQRFKFEGFVCRRRAGISNGFGVFMDEYAIDSANARFPIDLIREIPGIQVIADPRGRGMTLKSPADWKCSFVQLVNGKPPTLQNPLPRWPKEMIGLEVYPIGAQVPSEYSHFSSPSSMCGVVVYWTVIRPRKGPYTFRDTTPPTP